MKLCDVLLHDHWCSDERLSSLVSPSLLPSSSSSSSSEVWRERRGVKRVSTPPPCVSFSPGLSHLSGREKQPFVSSPDILADWVEVVTSLLRCALLSSCTCFPLLWLDCLFHALSLSRSLSLGPSIVLFTQYSLLLSFSLSISPFPSFFLSVFSSLSLSSAGSQGI